MRSLMKRLLVTLLAAAVPALAAAQTYPEKDKPIRIVVPFAPGGAPDVLGRLVAQGLGDAWRHTVIVENKTGAAGNIGVDLVARSASDGYTLAVVPVGNIVVNPVLFSNLPYKASDLAPIVLLATAENVLVVHAGVAARTLKDLIALARQKPDLPSFASPGAGSQAHLAGELLQHDVGIRLLHVPYKGVSLALNDVVGGQVTMMFSQLSTALPFIKSGQLRAIGLASAKRSPLMPDLPTIAEQGVARFEAVSWYALMAPANTPKAVIDKLNGETSRLLAKPDTRARLAALGMEAGGGQPVELATRIQTESARWADLIKKQNIKAE